MLIVDEFCKSKVPSSSSSCSKLADLIRSSITCWASIRDSLLVSSSFLRLSTAPALADELDDVVDVTDETVLADTKLVATTPVVVQLAIFGLSIDPVSLNPDPLLGFLSRHHNITKKQNKT